MARPAKKGLDYFSHDTDASTSREIEYLEAKYGLIGYALFLKILEKVYGHEGYFVPWVEIDAAIFAKHCGVEKQLLDEVVETCLELDLFSRCIYDANKVLTSASIQRRYLQATVQRANVKISPTYNLIKTYIDDKNQEEQTRSGVSTTGNSPEGELSTSESAQSKVKNKNIVERFEKIWSKYPVKDGKKAALNHFKASVKTEEDWLAINGALEHYLSMLATEEWRRPKNGSTWFNNWRDWEREEKVVHLTPKQRKDEDEWDKAFSQT